jgi:NAD(P)H-hydrate epimerase
LQRMAVLSIPEPAHGAALVIDGLADYGADISVRTLALIDWCNMQIQPVLSVDLPSGLDAATGAHTPTHCVRASATLALGLPLEGIFTQKARPMVGEIFLADMGIPKTLFAAPGVEMEVGVYFSESAILKLR